MDTAFIEEINRIILWLISPAFMLTFSLVLSAFYILLYCDTRQAKDISSGISYLFVALAYVFLIVYKSGAAPHGAIFRITILHLLINGAIRAYYAYRTERQELKAIKKLMILFSSLSNK